MIHHERWFREAFGEREISALVQKIIRKDRTEGTVPPEMMEELTTLALRAGMVEEILRLFPEEFPVYLAPLKDHLFDSKVSIQVNEDFSDWAPDFEEPDVSVMTYQTRYTDFEQEAPLIGREDVESADITTQVNVEVKGFYELDWEPSGVEDDEFTSMDEALGYQHQPFRARFQSAISGMVGSQEVEFNGITDAQADEGLNGDWGWYFTGKFTYETEVPFDPTRWKLVYEPDAVEVF